jgi:drug/metabolite transporter (DMT)-like permease
MYNAFLYLITVVIWGSTWLAIKYQLGIVSPELSIAYRFGLAASILILFSLVRRLPMRFELKSHGFFALQGFLLFSLNYFLVYLAEGYLTSGLVGLAGLAFVFWPELSAFNLSSQKVLGMGLSFIATISASLGNVVSARNQRHDLPVIQTNAYGMLYGAFFMFLLAIFRGAQLEFDTSASYIFSLLYLAIFGSVIAFGSYLTLLGRIGLDRAAYVTVIFPIIALLLSTVFEGLQWGAAQLVGVALVLLGNAVVLSKNGRIKLLKRFERKSVTG